MIELQEWTSGWVIKGMMRALLEPMTGYGSSGLANKHLFLILRDIPLIALAGGKKWKAQSQQLQQEMQSVTCPSNYCLLVK